MKVKTLTAAVVLWVFPTLVFGGCGDCPPKVENGIAVEFDYIVTVRPHHR